MYGITHIVFLMVNGVNLSLINSTTPRVNVCWFALNMIIEVTVMHNNDNADAREFIIRSLDVENC